MRPQFSTHIDLYRPKKATKILFHLSTAHLSSCTLQRQLTSAQTHLSPLAPIHALPHLSKPKYTYLHPMNSTKPYPQLANLTYLRLINPRQHNLNPQPLTHLPLSQPFTVVVLCAYLATPINTNHTLLSTPTHSLTHTPTPNYTTPHT